MIARLRAMRPTVIKHRWLIVGGIVLWILILLAGAVPTMKRVRQNVHDLEAANDRLASLSEWSIAGAWMGEAALRWEPALDAEYSRLFPDHDDREALFLDLARVARDSGVEPLMLEELPRHDNADTNDDEQLDEVDPAVADLLDRFAPDRTNLPSSELESFRLKAGFETDFANLTRFLSGLTRIDRAYSLERLRAEPIHGQIAVEMELAVYVQQLD